jgi:glyoxylase-like metal-dependent hydrolase (beta-lactamase superfamily II)
MANYICVTCGVQYAETKTEPEHCLICEDERQYVNKNGQTWTTLPALQSDHRNVLRTVERNLTGIRTEPQFAIGQQALLLQMPSGNVLWDCISLLDKDTVRAVRELGGISAIAISHPHFFSSMVEWSRAFDNAPIYLHADLRKYVMRSNPAIEYWEGQTKSLGKGLTLIRCGGHFKGSTVLHWSDGADARGALLTGDTIYVVQDRRYVSFMRSYPNLIPLNASAVRRIVGAVEPFAFDRIYGAWPDSIVQSKARESVARSAERYLAAIQG